MNIDGYCTMFEDVVLTLKCDFLCCKGHLKVGLGSDVMFCFQSV